MVVKYVLVLMREGRAVTLLAPVQIFAQHEYSSSSGISMSCLGIPRHSSLEAKLKRRVDGEN